MTTYTRAAYAALALAAWSCSNPAALDRGAADVGSVSIDPATSTVIVGSSAPLRAVVQDVAGRPLADATVFWAVKDPQIASVSSKGVVTALALGSTQVAASAGGHSGLATIAVSEGPVASVTVVPATVTMVVGQTAPLSVATRNANGVTITGRAVTWSSSNVLVAVVSAGGVVTGVAPGTATITAACGGNSASASVTVSPPPVATVTVSPAAKTLNVGQTTVLTASVRDATGATLTDRAVVWSTNNAAVASVSQAGVVTALAPGTATVTATSEGKSGAAAITVATPPPAPVASVAIQPTSLTLTVGGTGALSATPRDAAGTVLTGRAVTWTSNLDPIATVSSSGVVTARSPGTVTITATSEGKSATATVVVQAGPAAIVIVTPASTWVWEDDTAQLTATAFDAAGNWITGRPFTWTTSNATLATVSSSGVVLGRRAGVVTITATLDGKSGTSTVTVRP